MCRTNPPQSGCENEMNGPRAKASTAERMCGSNCGRLDNEELKTLKNLEVARTARAPVRPSNLDFITQGNRGKCDIAQHLLFPNHGISCPILAASIRAGTGGLPASVPAKCASKATGRMSWFKMKLISQGQGGGSFGA